MSAELIFQFLGEQWVLVVGLMMVLTLLVLHETRKAGPSLSISEAVQLVNSEGGVFLDIRDAADFARGHITDCLLYTSPSPRDLSTSRMPSSA